LLVSDDRRLDTMGAGSFQDANLVAPSRRSNAPPRHRLPAKLSPREWCTGG